MEEHVLLKRHTTFKIGGAARYFKTVSSVENLQEGIAFAKARGLSYIVLGGGSNVLFPDEGYPGVILKMAMRGMAHTEDGGNVHFEVAAGESWDDVVFYAVKQGWYGIENLSWIPGSAGAAPIQNIGAYGAEIRDVIAWVEVFDAKKSAIRRLSASECQFSYRDSVFKHGAGADFVVTRIALGLKKQGEAHVTYRDLADYFKGSKRRITLSEVREALKIIRGRKFPDLAHYGTAGSFFKNPVLGIDAVRALRKQFPGMPLYAHDQERSKVPLAWILDHALKMRGFRIKNAGCYEAQPLVLVNYGGASASEILQLAEMIQKKVHDIAPITLEREVACIKV